MRKCLIFSSKDFLEESISNFFSVRNTQRKVSIGDIDGE